MKPNPLAVIALAAALPLVACAKEEGTAPPVDTAVAGHAAEAAARSMEERMETGMGLYAAQCSACHQANGQGLAGAFPPLAESDYLAPGPGPAIDAVLNGLSGKITVNGTDYN
ncbi:MAG: nitrite reductase, copper-containing, partial [Xanthomonadales bacterium]|nr:nitrite reductase, copper-containing [Xanthomonadales bacterium]